MTTRVLGRGTRNFSSAIDSLPPGSPSWFLMEKVTDYTSERGGAGEEYSPWLLTDLMQNTIAFVHEVVPAELGWLGAVAISAVSIRALLFPLCLQSIREGRLKSTLLPQYSEMLREMAEMKTPSSSNNRDSEKLQSLQKRYVAFTAKYGNVALKGTLASAVQIPMIMTGIVACNGMALNPSIFPAVALESPLWLASASLPDPWYILPAINSGLVWFNMSYFGSIDATATPTVPAPSGKTPAVSGQDEQSKRIKDLITSRMGSEAAERTSAQIDSLYKSKMMQYGKKLFPLFIFGVTMKFPAITLVYTISNIGGAMAQNYLITNRRFQTLLDIPAQAKRSGDEVEEAMRRAEEIRAKISEIGNHRKTKRMASEQVARDRFRRMQPADCTGVTPTPVSSPTKSMSALLEELKQKKAAAGGSK